MKTNASFWERNEESSWLWTGRCGRKNAVTAIEGMWQKLDAGQGIKNTWD